MRQKFIAATCATLSAAFILFAYAFGPDAHHTAVPGPTAATTETSCNASGCHEGTPLNGGGGNVAVSFPNGLSYTPGQQQTFTVTITDSKARVYGFEMTARLASNLTGGQAGTFTPKGQQQVLCAANSLSDLGTGRPPGKSCPASTPLEFIEHSQPYSTNTFTVAWTPPATNVGNIGIYISGNAANGDGNNTGDHIYTANYTLTPTGGGGNTPSVTAVISASAFNQNAGLAPGTWLEIYGQNLSTSTRGWGESDFNGNDAPTSLDGVTVTIGGKNAFVDYISPGQVNVQAPDGIPIGDGVPVIVTNSSGSSTAFGLRGSNIAPAVLAPSAFDVGGKQYVVAQFSDQTYVGRPGMIAGLNFRPAKVGDTVVIYGVGFGPVNPGNPAGVICTQANGLVSVPHFRFGQTPATLAYDGLVPGFVGLYQFNVKVPSVSPGDLQLNVDVGGITLNQSLFITVGQ